MKYKSSEINASRSDKMNGAKSFLVGFVLILASFYFMLAAIKVSAVETEITGTMYDKNENSAIEESERNFIKIDQTSGGKKLTYIQGNGENDKVAIKFTITDFPKTATSFMIVESERTDSSSLADADRYSKVMTHDADGNVVWEWIPSEKNVEMNGIAGEANFSETNEGRIDAQIVYRLRKGSYGLKFFRIYYYNAETIETNPSGQFDVVYVISRPIDKVEQGPTCTEKNDTICISYSEDSPTSRISRELKIFLPTSVAFNFSVVDIVPEFDALINNTVVDNYTAVVQGSSIYGINYFYEEANGDVTPSINVDDANRSYMYTNFTYSGIHTQGKTEWFIDDENYNYTLHLKDFKANEIDYIYTKVDSIGAYHYYLRDIFGNEKEVVQSVTNVKNRAIITKVQKGNAEDEGFDAVEEFTNSSVKIELTLTVETHFELGVCLNNKCSEIKNLTSEDLGLVKYWRVNVQIDATGNDIDAYDPGELASVDYAHEKYAAEGSMYNIYCKTAANCTGVQNYDENKVHEIDGAGFKSFTGNVLTMYVGASGRYRFYIEDLFGNNSWGIEDDRLEEEFRNPRVEVYGIDKAAPEIIFEHEGAKVVGAETHKQFSLETYDYYRGIELEKIDDKFEYDGRVRDTNNAVERYIDSTIYYPLNRDDGRPEKDKYFDDEQAIMLSNVRVSEYVYYYSGTPIKELYADYSAYDRVGSNNYVKELYDGAPYDNSIVTILKNTKNNSNGLKLSGGTFTFNEIKYYHNDGVSSVCEQIGSISGYESYVTKTELDCVNYYIDHGVDFIIEFHAEDSVGNVGVNRVYVAMVDTTPPGFTLHTTTDAGGNTIVDTTKLIKASNIGTKCRMEIGQEIGSGKVQNMASLLNCYNIDVNATVDATNTYNFEDNVYSLTSNDGLSFYNRINGNISQTPSYVKMYILSDRKDAGGEYVWVDLGSQTFIPNKTGYYDLKFVIYDNTMGVSGTNQLTVVVSYYVDRKIVLIEPLANEKFYGENDPGLEYCVYIDVDNHYDIRFSDNPYSNPEIFTKIYCSNQTVDEVNAGKSKLFQQNLTSDFFGNISRLESSWYNSNAATPSFINGHVGVENNYVGLYNTILGTLNINLKSDETTEDADYIVKIHPTYRVNTKYNNNGAAVENDNLITKNLLEDDDSFSQSNVNLKIKQAILNVIAAGGNKFYGEKDTNHENYLVDNAEEKYLNGFIVDAVEGLKNDGVQYKDDISLILGVLRREIGENVGLYKICNFRGTDNLDNILEDPNNMYLNCIDPTASGVVFNTDASNFEGYTYDAEGKLIINADFVKSRALYIKPNEKVAGKTLNYTTNARDNEHANYVINYTEGEYLINSIDLVVQAAPGQRREYNFTNTYDPDPWEIILYGLVDGNIKEYEIPAEGEKKLFNGYTATIIEGDYYNAQPNEKDTADGSEVSKIEANFSEERPDGWFLYHEGKQLTGYKTNETYELLRSTQSGSSAGSAKLVREPGKDGGWYLYYDIDADLNVLDSGTPSLVKSQIAVMTNGRSQCSYDATGHIVSIDAGVRADCKNYNLVYNPYYTNQEGYTIETRDGAVYSDGEFVYKSNNKTCLVLDPDIKCENTVSEPLKIYKIMFEVYRRELILEFNSAIETIKFDGATNYDMFYGKRYEFYKNNYFDIGYYAGKSFYPENYLFLCYQNETTMSRSAFDSEHPTTTGCTGDYRYGLTAGDTWANIGIYFKMHELVSAEDSEYYSEDDSLAIPAGVYYIYSDIADEQKKNYNYKYLGGAMTIKSLSVEIQITSYAKEYGEKYYSSYGVSQEYSGLSAMPNLSCLQDGEFINVDTGLVNLGEEVYCVDNATDTGNSYKNIYGFYVNGLDSKDIISENFDGRPTRNRSVSLASDDFNGLQDNVGTYDLKKGTIKTINNNPFVNADNSCLVQTKKGDYGLCVVAAGKLINNYVIAGETRTYAFDMYTPVEEEKDVDVVTPESLVILGRVFITPAELKITVNPLQTKMYGCAYNVYNVSQSSTSYTYNDGYANCVENDGDYFDLGYQYVVSGDKDYQIANNGYDYDSDDSYTVSGINGSATFRPTTTRSGIKAHALNFGTLYRIPDTTENREKIRMSAFVDAAYKSQASRSGAGKLYQQQTVGNYILTLGDVDATDNVGKDTYVNSCNANNIPGIGTEFKYICKNYNIDYYGTRVYESDVDVDQTYEKDGGFPTEILFTITKRTAYVYTQYDQKIYGEADIYNDESKAAVYLCGDYNMDNVVNDDDNISESNPINKDVYYGFCTQESVNKNKDLDGANDVLVDYGLTRYYTKYNSLAKYPWNGIEGRNDVQTDVVAGRISRKGMNGAAPTTDDIKGFYDYVYEKEEFYGSVHLIGSFASDNEKYASTYGNDNYLVNYYEDGFAVNEKGEKVNDDIDETPIQFEIVLRQIKVAFVSFTKIYGEQDIVTDYDILVCAPSETFDFENMKCVGKSPLDKHGLSATHMGSYAPGGILDQEKFKNDFVVRFKRVLGENVSCGTSTEVTVTLNGYFYGEGVNAEGNVYTTTLKCNNTAVADKSVYETLAYIDQSLNSVPGFNYQISYQLGYVEIDPRPILITPIEGQGFVYGDYHDTLIPAIKFEDSLVAASGIVQPYGLVHSTDAASQDGVCLNNINYYNNGIIDGVHVGTCFYINDRMDEYSPENNMTTSRYDSGAVNSDRGLANITIKNFVFGDVYESEGSERSALNRNILTASSTRYNRNVGKYIINRGDLKDQTGNYVLSYDETVEYIITMAKVLVTPDSNTIEEVSGTTQVGQYKIYGEQDKELTFGVTTSYQVKAGHYAIYNSNIIKVKTLGGVEKLLAELDKYVYDATNKVFTKDNTNGQYIYLETGDTVTLSGFAYGENNGDVRNYGKAQDGIKSGLEKKVNQTNVVGSLYYDIQCKDAAGVTCTIGTKTLVYGIDTSRILLGYLYVDGWAQAAGVYNIVNGFKVAVNEWEFTNYDLFFTANVKFTIIPRPIGLQIENVSKTYGQATDSISCDFVSGVMLNPCVTADGILMSGNTLLKHNFSTYHFSGSGQIESILNNYEYNGSTYNNSKLYSQNAKFVNGLVPEDQKAYSIYGAAEDKNTEQLGVYVSRDERNINNDSCMYVDEHNNILDTFGLCEDVGSYYLRFYGYLNTVDSITTNAYNTSYKPARPSYDGLEENVEMYYYSSYFGYNPNYFVIVVDNDAHETAVTPDLVFADNALSTSRAPTSGKDYDKLLKATGTLTINKKSVALYVNTSYFEEGLEIYYVGQNTTAPNLPTVNNSHNLNYDLFHGINVPAADRKEAVGGIDTYGDVIWGTHPAQVRKGDKLSGQLAYCNKIITSDAYDVLRSDGLLADYNCSAELVYKDNKEDVNTNLTGFIPIVRDTNMLSIVSSVTEDEVADKDYENLNYSVIFYPGALRIEEDDTKPVVEVNRKDVFIEANAIGTYMYECVGAQKTTTYVDCGGAGSGISVIGKTELTEGDPILNWLNTQVNYDAIIKVDLPLIAGCESNEHDCTSSAFFELEYGKGQTDFVSQGGINPGVESSFVYPFTMQKPEYIKNSGVNSLKELFITLVDWFGVTAYDQGEIRDGQTLDKKFDKYWYIVIEKEGTNGSFDISKVGNYKVHFYVMDNSGNVSDGNMYEEVGGKNVLQTTYKNVGTLHIVDTTKPVVGTMNLYNGFVRCTDEADCSNENSWVVAVDTYLPINTLLRYDSEGNPDGDGLYVNVGEVSLSNLSSLTKYTRTQSNTGVYEYEIDNDFGKYVLVAAGKKASALKHYSWSNSTTGIFLTITGGSDNSYTVNNFPEKNVNDPSQWQHYYSRDGGITWFEFDRAQGISYAALDLEGTREILIKAVDSGVQITSATEVIVTYMDKFYGAGAVENVTREIATYQFVDTSVHDAYLKEFNNMSSDDQRLNDADRNEALANIGWNMSDDAPEDSVLSETISQLIYGKPSTGEPGVASGYKFYRDRQTAYLDRTKPVITFGDENGEKLYVYEYGCSFCTIGYEEEYSTAVDLYPVSVDASREIKSTAFNKNSSILINHRVHAATKGQVGSLYQESYVDVSQEKPRVLNYNGGLGGDAYAMNGNTNDLDIRNVYPEERRYIIYGFDKNDVAQTPKDLSNYIPTSDTSTVGEEYIYNVISRNPNDYKSTGDYTYTIIYSVFDKAGNESVYIARGVIYASLIPEIEIDNTEPDVVQQVAHNSYSMSVEQGADVEKVAENLMITAGYRSQFITQTIYYNGELVVNNKSIKDNIYDGFTTDVPGVYEITYNLKYRHYGDNGQSEIIEAEAVKLKIVVEATPPLVEAESVSNASTIIMFICLLTAGFTMAWFGSLSKKKN